jgi:hypothetical protein
MEILRESSVEKSSYDLNKQEGTSMSKQTGASVAHCVWSISVLLASSLAFAAVPHGWFIAGNRPTQYESGVDMQSVYGGRPSAYLKATAPSVDGFGTLMQQFRADHYLGKRVRFSAFVKTDAAQDWAGLWMRVDDGPKQIAFDNMQSRPIKGTTDWRKYEVVLDVPPQATGISFGILLSGSGTVWLNNADIEIVSSTVPTTGGETVQMPNEPVNLNFEN